MKIKNLIPEFEFKNIDKNINLEIKYCTANYKKVEAGCLLFLLPGVNFDTYELVNEYIKSKPDAIITEDSKRFPKTKIPLIEVRSARRAFAYAMSNISEIDYEKLKFIGITGTNGKTSTATMLAEILKFSGERVGFIGTGKICFENTNFCDEKYTMTSPDPDLLYPIIRKMQLMGCETVVMEVSSHALELEKISPISFDIGIFTGLSHEHMDFHGNMERYFLAKEKLIKISKRSIINFDDPWGRRLYEKYQNKSTGIGVLFGSDISALEVENYGLLGIGYILRAKNFLTKIKLSLPGIYNIYNSMLAFEAAYEFGCAPKKIKEALFEIKRIDGRCEIIRGDVTVIIDYAHTPLALENLLKTVKSSKNIGQNIVLVFGCGGERDALKRPKMAEIAEKYADKTIVTSDNPRKEKPEKIIAEIISGFGKGQYGVIVDRQAAISFAIKKASIGDIVIIAGKGHERYIYDSLGYHPFDERKIIERALELRGCRT